MKPIRISIKGFNSFVEEQTIDFEKLSNKGIFGIFGSTGSGKSSILDAMTFALYGKIARESSHSNYININSDVATVVFEFEVSLSERKRYKIIREIKRDKSGTKTKVCKVIDVFDEKVIAEKERETKDAIKSIIGLEYDDFVKTVVLPQGAFNDFLKIDGKDRRDILERLFNLEKYGKNLEDKISKKLKEVENNKVKAEGELNAYGVVEPDLIESQKKLIEELANEEKLLLEQKERKSKEVQDIKRFIDIKENLEIQEKELEVELSKKELYNLIQTQINNAKNYNILSSSIDDYKSYIKIGKKLKEDYNLQKEKLSSTLRKKESIDKKFEEINIEKEENYLDYLKKLDKLGNIKSTYERYIKNETLLVNTTKEYENFSKEYDNICKKNDSLSNSILNYEENIYDISKKILENDIKKEERERVSEAVKLLNIIKDSTQNINEIQKDIKVLDENILSNSENLELLNEEKSNIEKGIQQVTNEILNIENNKYYDKTFVINTERVLRERIEECKKGESNRERKRYIEDKLEEILNFTQSTEIKLKEVEKKIFEYEKKYSKNLANDIKINITKNIKIGDKCPVCNNIINSLESICYEEYTDEITEELKEKINILSSQKVELLAESNYLYKEKSDLEQELEELSDELSFEDNKITEDILLKELRELDEKYNNLLNEYFLKNEKLSELKDNNTKVSNNIVIFKAKNDEIEKQVIKQKSKLEELYIKIKFNEEELKKIEFTNIVDVENFIKSINDRETLLIELRSEKDKLENHLRSLREEKQKILDKEKKVNVVKLELKSKYDTLTSQVDSDKKEIIDAIGTVKDPSEEYNKLSNKIENIDNEFNSLKLSKENIDKEYLDINKESIILDEKLNQARDLARKKQKDLYIKIESIGVGSFKEISEKEKLEKLNILLDEVTNWYINPNDILEKENQIEKYNKNVNEKMGAIQNAKSMLDGKKISYDEFNEASEELANLNSKYNKVFASLEREKTIYNENINKIEKIKNITDLYNKFSEEMALLKDLRTVVGAKKFVEFMALKQLKYVTMQATQRLMQITKGAYSLEIDKEGSFKIRDNKNGGLIRSVKTLSGGETFVVSLSLALALSSQIQLKGVAPLEFFFLDEGFGTLDDDLLDVVIDSLEQIQNDRLKIGVISHIEQLKQRVPVKLIVTPAVSGEGGTKVKLEYS